ncbi:hypothetical protein GCM10009539_63320 [Cryptosporangium japonicum]|uniref:Uncharacterized protein n=1 Tax=Cryptosporangium japonicum TaxID=80872 RepID=A0ABN0UZH5_9ACTN
MPDLSGLAARAADALRPRFGEVTLTPDAPLAAGARSTVFRAHLGPSRRAGERHPESAHRGRAVA